MRIEHWEDEYICGSPGFWYVIVDEIQAGYFASLARARRFVRRCFIKHKA